MTDFFDKLKDSRPTNAGLQEQRERALQGPAINEALSHPPLGSITMYAGASDPLGGKWFVADGRLLNQADYPDYFALVGTTWNTGGEGAGQFRLPDLRGRGPVGAGQSGTLTNRALGGYLGEETHLTTSSEMPSHAHTGVSDYLQHAHGGASDYLQHAHGGITSNYIHQHTDYIGYFSMSGSFGAGRTVYSPVGADGSANQPTSNDNHNHTIATDYQGHQHVIATDYQGHQHTLTINATGGGLAHNNMPPVAVVNFIVRVLL